MEYIIWHIQWMLIQWDTYIMAGIRSFCYYLSWNSWVLITKISYYTENITGLLVFQQTFCMYTHIVHIVHAYHWYQHICTIIYRLIAIVFICSSRPRIIATGCSAYSHKCHPQINTMPFIWPFNHIPWTLWNSWIA